MNDAADITGKTKVWAVSDIAEGRDDVVLRVMARHAGRHVDSHDLLFSMNLNRDEAVALAVELLSAAGVGVACRSCGHVWPLAERYTGSLAL